MRVLDLTHNWRVDSKGWHHLARLLASPQSRLEVLLLERNYIEDDAALIFAGALTNNSTLKRLSLASNSKEVSDEGWLPFENLVCDPSSVDATLFSNHTLESVGHDNYWSFERPVPASLVSSLDLNHGNNKEHVAIMKILKVHQTFDMKSLFEWELKALPRVVAWFDKARAIPNIDRYDIDRRKLRAIYQFVRTMPGELEGLNNQGTAGSKRKVESMQDVVQEVTYV